MDLKNRQRISNIYLNELRESIDIDPIKLSILKQIESIIKKLSFEEIKQIFDIEVINPNDPSTIQDLLLQDKTGYYMNLVNELQIVNQTQITVQLKSNKK